MPRFFISSPTPPTTGEPCLLEGDTAHHISRSLRMKPGEEVTLCDGKGLDYSGEILAITDSAVTVTIKEVLPSQTEPSVQVTLFQGLPKGDKMELIVQKAVELGAYAIAPVLTRRSISQPDQKSAEKKTQRWQKIANEAAQQSQRGSLPQVRPLISFAQALEQCDEFDKILVCYEGGGLPIAETVLPDDQKIAVFIGPEGGWEESEIEALRQRGAQIITLGPRILRTETAPLAVLSVLMYVTGNM